MPRTPGKRVTRDFTSAWPISKLLSKFIYNLSYLLDEHLSSEGPVETQWAVSADLKWQEIFDQFLFDELGLQEAGKSEEELCKRAWERLSSSLEKIKTLKNISVDERLERVPNVYENWSPSYYATVCEFWNLVSRMGQLCAEVARVRAFRIFDPYQSRFKILLEFENPTLLQNWWKLLES